MSKVYLFPFEKIDKNSSIAIYGAGLVGSDYMRQLRETGYCNVLFVAARNYKEINPQRMYGFPLTDPDEFLKRNDYDYVVISTTNEVYQEEMIGLLSEAGVEKNKIVLPEVELQVREITYSQHGEDRIIYEAFKHMGYFRDGKLPTYIDIGAHHPYEISNSALFYQLGCHGVNIEANPELIVAFEKERPDDINLCFGVGPEEGKFPFYITEFSGLNTLKKENLKYNEFLSEQNTGKRDSFPIEKIIEVPVRKLSNIIKEYCGGKWPDFLSIDIEGMEYESLSVCDLTDGPKLMAVEVNYNGDLFIKMLDEKGYFPYLWYRENILFVQKELEYLVHAHDKR